MILIAEEAGESLSYLNILLCPIEHDDLVLLRRCQHFQGCEALTFLFDVDVVKSNGLVAVAAAVADQLLPAGDYVSSHIELPWLLFSDFDVARAGIWGLAALRQKLT